MVPGVLLLVIGRSADIKKRYKFAALTLDLALRTIPVDIPYWHEMYQRTGELFERIGDTDKAMKYSALAGKMRKESRR